MQEISRDRVPNPAKTTRKGSYEWLLNNGSLTKQMVGHVMEVKGRERIYRDARGGLAATTTSVTSKTTWAMVKTTEQAQAMETRRKVNVVGAINGGGFDMSNGRPSGALVLDGTVIQSANSNDFLGRQRECCPYHRWHGIYSGGRRWARQRSNLQLRRYPPSGGKAYTGLGQQHPRLAHGGRASSRTAALCCSWWTGGSLRTPPV